MLRLSRFLIYFVNLPSCIITRKYPNQIFSHVPTKIIFICLFGTKSSKSLELLLHRSYLSLITAVTEMCAATYHSNHCKSRIGISQVCYNR